MIEVKNLTKRFGALTAVDDVSFEIEQGETFALLGPNGSGKTTTLKCLVGLTRPSAGEIKVNSLDVWESGRSAKQLMSYLPQRVSFQDSLTGREVMKFYCQLRRLPARRIDDVLGDARFHFNGSFDKPVGEFSGGMIQRLGLAVACLPDAPILLLDEPTASLDPEAAIQFRDFLKSLKRAGKTIVFTSHALADVEQLADRVAILVGGKLAALESIEGLREGLTRDCRMRIRLAEVKPGLIEAAIQAGASEAAFEGASMIVVSRAEERLAIIRAIEAAGGNIERFSTEEQSIENIYLRYINAEKTDQLSRS